MRTDYSHQVQTAVEQKDILVAVGIFKQAVYEGQWPQVIEDMKTCIAEGYLRDPSVMHPKTFGPTSMRSGWLPVSHRRR
ncbi:hypothetical protein [Nesterenkonia muleiensis]|uniref:hypothetical protein n=1 Tax=Nesterenkonia muleiensis TaxID=2282648 RepID=UPI000E716D81|nr:hypothetical protein [Nesterenkonia muleiensis]